MGQWLLTNSLWIIGIGLMLASSGLDGAYMALWMPAGYGALGYILNTTADIASMVLTYFFGRLQQGKKAQRVLSWFLLIGEVVSVGYSWFFSWRQLLIRLPLIEPLDYEWIAPVAAGFIPLLLAFIGYAESLMVGKFETTVKPGTARRVKAEAPVVADVNDDIAEPDIVITEPDIVTNTANAAMALPDTVRQLLAYYADNPLSNQTDAGSAVSRSRQWVSGQLAELEKAGIVHRNGDGVRVNV